MMRILPEAFRALVPMVVCIFLSLACGGGGSGGTPANPAGSPNHLRTKVQPAALFNILPGTTFTITSLSGSGVNLLSETSLSGDDFQSFELTFNFDENYLFQVNRYGAPFLRTILLGSQIEKASAEGVLKIGEVNAITTLFADLSSGGTVAKTSSTKARRSKSESEIRTTISNYFTSNASFDFSQLSFQNINDGLLQTTPEFEGMANRINLLLFYIGTVADLTSRPSAEGVSALVNLFAGLTNPNTTVGDLAALLDNPALPKSGLGAKAIFDRIVSGGFALQTDNSLPLSEVLNIFNDPKANVSLLQTAMSLATSQVEGSMGGYQLEGVELQLLSENGVAVQTATTSSDGSYQMKALEAGRYVVTPQAEGMVFRPKSFSVELKANQRLKGYDFTSFQYLVGSLNVPDPSKVVKGTTYTAADGETELTGSFTILAPDPAKVLSGTYYGDETGLSYGGNVNLPSADQVLAGTHYGPGNALVGSAAQSVITRQAPVGQGQTSRFKVSYY